MLASRTLLVDQPSTNHLHRDGSSEALEDDRLTDKSHLAVALGVKAIKNGFSTTHFLVDDLIYVPKGDAAVPPGRLKAKRYLNSALLVTDEVGFRPLDR